MRQSIRHAPPAGLILLPLLAVILSFGFTRPATSVAAAAATPVIASVVPRSPEPSKTAQMMTVQGRGFEKGLELQVKTPEGTSAVYRDDAIMALDDASFRVSVMLLTRGRYTLVATNRDGGSSDAFTLDVRDVPKPPLPAIDVILPDQIVARPEQQDLTVQGRLFEPNLWVIVTDPLGVEVVDAVVRDIRPTGFVLRIKLELKGTYEMVITNPSGGVSNHATFTVK